MSVLNKEKATYSISTFIMFLNIIGENQRKLSQEIEKYREEAYTLLVQLTADELGPLAASLQLNQLIEKFNHLIKTPYPVLVADSAVNLVKGDIVAFEHYLNQELKANHLSLQEESLLFSDSLKLWEQVGVSLSAKEGVSEFAALIEKLNSMLPDNERYPLPDITQF